jgi:hypothetical protein
MVEEISPKEAARPPLMFTAIARTTPPIQTTAHSVSQPIRIESDRFGRWLTRPFLPKRAYVGLWFVTAFARRAFSCRTTSAGDDLMIAEFLEPPLRERR